jgi:hypothetical protein
MDLRRRSYWSGLIATVLATNAVGWEHLRGGPGDQLGFRDFVFRCSVSDVCARRDHAQERSGYQERHAQGNAALVCQAWQRVSWAEERIARCEHMPETQRLIAQRGAIEAAERAGDDERVTQLRREWGEVKPAKP